MQLELRCKWITAEYYLILFRVLAIVVSFKQNFDGRLTIAKMPEMRALDSVMVKLGANTG